MSTHHNGAQWGQHRFTVQVGLLFSPQTMLPPCLRASHWNQSVCCSPYGHLNGSTASSASMHVASWWSKIRIQGWLLWVPYCLVINCFPSKRDLFCNSTNNDRTQKEKKIWDSWKSQWYGSLAWNYALNRREQLMEAAAAFLASLAFLVIVENDSSLIALKTI